MKRQTGIMPGPHQVNPLRSSVCKVLFMTLAVTLLLANSFAVVDPYGWNHKDYQNVRLQAGITCERVTANGMKISGTKVELVCAGPALSIPFDPPDSDPIIAVRLSHEKLTIGGEIVYDRDVSTVWGPTRPTPALCPFYADESPLAIAPVQQQYEAWPDVKTPSACRFASNHFTSATDLVIELTLSFKFMRQSTTIGNFPEAVVTAISPKVWNQLCAWRTELTQTGKNLPANLLLITQTCYEKIEAGFLAAKYAIGPGNSSTKTAILERLKTCTAVAACTHGAQTGVDASKGPAQYMDWYTIVGKVQENGDRYLVPVVAAAYPPMSVLLLYACHTLPGSPFPPDTFFKLWRLPLADFEPQLNSFGGGFDQTLLIADASAGLAGWDNIYKHPEAMFLKLSEGFPIKKALDYANATFPPIYFDGADLLTTPMTGAFGDNMATTKYVYLTAAERIALSTAVPPPSAWEIPDLGWYKIPPPQ